MDLPRLHLHRRQYFFSLSLSPAVCTVGSFDCRSATSAARCTTLGGSCEPVRDGYPLLALAAPALGVLLYFGVLRTRLIPLQRTDVDSWRVAAASRVSLLGARVESPDAWVKHL